MVGPAARSYLVIGGGMVGAASALRLRAAEFDVTLIDPGDAERANARREQVKALAAKALTLAEAMGALAGARGALPGTTRQNVDALRGLYRTPWQLALQRWMESVAPGERTFTRPSRRETGTPEVVLPGRMRQGWLLNVVLDTKVNGG